MKHKLCNTCKRKKRCTNCRGVQRQGCMRHTDNIAYNEAARNRCAGIEYHYFWNKKVKKKRLKKKQGGKA